MLDNTFKSDLSFSETKGGIYIHIPYCRQKCVYCDFYSGGVRIADWKVFIDSLLNELKSRKKEVNFRPHTLYIGGGTPSLIPPEYIHRLIEGIRKDLQINFNFEEFTIEVNPEDVDIEKCKIWKDLGVNRISMGIQSLDDKVLKIIGRNHDSTKALNAYSILRKFFNNISLDIIFGLPSQTPENYVSDLKKIVALNPEHISVYSLMLEKGTTMEFLVRKRMMTLPSEEDWEKMYENTHDSLSKAGYKRYEISNYSRPGFESIHNNSYWIGSPYLGLGPGAHSYDGNRVRRANVPDLKGYLNYFSDLQKNESCFYTEEKLNDIELREEMIMTRLRTSKGLNLTDFHKRFGDESWKSFIDSCGKFTEKGYLISENNFLRFTPQGWALFDVVLTGLI